jgi:transposase
MTDNAENTNIQLLDWDVLIASGIWPLDGDEPTIEVPERSAREPEDVSDVEWAALTLANVLPPDCGSDRRATISSAIWVVATGKPWTLLPQRFGSWDAQRRRFSRWAHGGHWTRIADAIEAADVPHERKRLYRRVAAKARRQTEMLPEHRLRVTGYRY